MSEQTPQEAMAELSKAWLDLMYEIAKPMVRFAERMNLELRPWVQERVIRERWKQ